MSQFKQGPGLGGCGDADAAAARNATPESPMTEDDADEPTQAFAEAARQCVVQLDFRRLRLDPLVPKSPVVRLLICLEEQKASVPPPDEINKRNPKHFLLRNLSNQNAFQD